MPSSAMNRDNPPVTQTLSNCTKKAYTHIMSYVILGRAIKAEWLSIGTLLTTAAVTGISMSGGSKKEKTAAVQPEAMKVESSSSEEEEFIRNFVAEAEKADRESQSKH